MRLGIVGHEAAKFTAQTERDARESMARFITLNQPEVVISGRCPLGGIDIWAIEVAKILGFPTKEYPPEVPQWDGGAKIGFKQRNLQIANNSDLVLVVLAKEFPDDYTGRRFSECYHCKRHNAPHIHIKSGGCWTAWQAPARAWEFV